MHADMYSVWHLRVIIQVHYIIHITDTAHPRISVPLMRGHPQCRDTFAWNQ